MAFFDTKIVSVACQKLLPYCFLLFSSLLFVITIATFYLVVLGISLVIGIVLGYLVNKYKQTVLGFTLGGYMGYLLG